VAGTKLVIFDCDGVLVDSEPISISVLRDVFAASGLVIGEAQAYELFLGRSMSTIAECVETDFGLVLSENHLDQIRAALFRRFEAELMPTPGIRETLDALTMARCVASSSQPERIRFSLRVTGLLESLEPNIYSATMVKRGKPFPDLFLHAASGMHVAPADCLVIEDSPAGIQAAQSAGMRVFAFAGGTHAARPGFREALLSLGPDLVFDHMRQLPALIADQQAQKAF
jgi:HAD superfamily hydrolase (TIGR01509 family)